MNKKGQVTIFIIISIMVVVGVALFFVFKDSINPDKTSTQTEEVSTFVSDCLEKTTKEVILGIGHGGGYFYPTDFSTNLGTTYYYLDNKNYMPSIEKIEDEISKAISQRLASCTKNFTSFLNYDSINEGKIQVIAKVSEEKIYVDLEYPLRIVKGDKITLLKDFSFDLEVPLGKFHSIAKDMNKIEKDKQGICLTCNSRIAVENKVTIDMFDYEVYTTIFTIKDENSKIDNDIFEFVFANDYSNGL